MKQNERYIETHPQRMVESDFKEKYFGSLVQ